MRQKTRLSIAVMLFFFLGCAPKQAEDDDRSASSPPKANQQTSPVRLSVLGWNVESGGSDPSAIAKQLGEHVEQSGAKIVALQEVDPDAFTVYGNVLTAWDAIQGGSGRDDRLMILFDRSRYLLLEHKEPNSLVDIVMNPGNDRSPLMALFADKETGDRFWLINVQTDNEALRIEQARGLREWARQQSTAVVLIGDLNFDYDIKTSKGNDGFRELIKDNVLAWVKPDPLVDSNWADNNRDGVDDHPDALRCGCFVAGAAKNWNLSSAVLVIDDDFPDNETTSDHRPILVK